MLQHLLLFNKVRIQGFGEVVISDRLSTASEAADESSAFDKVLGDIDQVLLAGIFNQIV